MPEQLKPCPFCGSTEITDHYPPESTGVGAQEIRHPVNMICEDCGAQGPEAETLFDAEVEWNTRKGE